MASPGRKGGRKEGEKQNIPISFIHLLCARHSGFKDEQNRAPIFEEVTKTVPISEDLLKCSLHVPMYNEELNFYV